MCLCLLVVFCVVLHHRPKISVRTICDARENHPRNKRTPKILCTIQTARLNQVLNFWLVASSSFVKATHISKELREKCIHMVTIPYESKLFLIA